MKHYISSILLSSLFFCSMSSMEEQKSSSNPAEEEQPVECVVSAEDQQLSQLLAQRWNKRIDAEQEKFDEKKMLKEVCSLDGNLSVLVEGEFYNLQKEKYKNLVDKDGARTNKAIYSLFGLRLHPGIENLTSLDLTKRKVEWKGKRLPNLSELLSLTELKTSGCELEQLDGALLPQSLKELHVSRCNLAHYKLCRIEQLDSLQKLIASHNGFTRIDQDKLPPCVTELDLSNNSFVQPEKMGLQKLTYLTKLDLSKNSELTGCSASELPTSLQELDLQDNKKLQPEQIQLGGLPNLTEVNLRGVDLSTLKGTQLPAFLTNIDLSFNSKIEVFDACWLPPGVKELSLYDCELKKICNFASHFTALTELDLSLNLKDQDFDCAELPSTVTELTMYGPKTCNNLQHLKGITNLDFSLNDFIEFPDCSNNGALITLDMSHAQKKLKCDEVRLPVQLQQLNLSNCEIVLPQAFVKLLALQRLDISNMKLQAMPDLSKLIALTKLNVSKNKLTQLDGKLLPSNLKELGLSQNNIQKLALAACANLAKLAINKNYILEIDGAADLPVSLQELKGVEQVHARFRYKTTGVNISNKTKLTNLNIFS